MTFLSLGNTRSGLPGRSETCNRNLCPHVRAILLTRSSGFVSLLRMSAIRLLRSVRESVSIACDTADVIPLTASHAAQKSYTAAALNARKIFAFSSPRRPLPLHASSRLLRRALTSCPGQFSRVARAYGAEIVWGLSSLPHALPCRSRVP